MQVLLSTGRRPVSDQKKGILSADLFSQTSIISTFPAASYECLKTYSKNHSCCYTRT